MRVCFLHSRRRRQQRVYAAFNLKKNLCEIMFASFMYMNQLVTLYYIFSVVFNGKV